MEKGYMILKPKVGIRKDWEDFFWKLHENGDDKALMGDVFEDENFEGW